MRRHCVPDLYDFDVGSRENVLTPEGIVQNSFIAVQNTDMLVAKDRTDMYYVYRIVMVIYL